MSQISFDDELAQGAAEAVLAAGPQPGAIERHRYERAYGEVHGHGHFGLRMVGLWEIGLTHPGGALMGDLDPTERCRPTILSADWRPDLDQQGCGSLAYRGACLGCEWEGPVHAGSHETYQIGDEDAAVADALDHAWPGLRDAPLLPGGWDHRPKKLGTFRELYEAWKPGWWDDAGPVRSARKAGQTRAHTTLGGRYDFGVES